MPFNNNEERRRYYAKSQNRHNHRNPWDPFEEKLVMEHVIPDSQLSKILGRSVQAIHLKRWKMRKEGDCVREFSAGTEEETESGGFST